MKLFIYNPPLETSPPFRNPQESNNIASGLACRVNREELTDHLTRVFAAPGSIDTEDFALNLSTNPEAAAAVRAVFFGGEEVHPSTFSPQTAEILGEFLSFGNDAEALALAADLLGLFQGHLKIKRVEHLSRAIERIEANMK